jgi:hypothetical protein
VSSVRLRCHVVSFVSFIVAVTFQPTSHATQRPRNSPRQYVRYSQRCRCPPRRPVLSSVRRRHHLSTGHPRPPPSCHLPTGRPLLPGKTLWQYVRYSRRCRCPPRSSTAPKIQSKIPAGRVNHVHTRIWSAHISAAHDYHETDRGLCLCLL